jgi:hypothetical protein
MVGNDSWSGLNCNYSFGSLWFRYSNALIVLIIKRYVTATVSPLATSAEGVLQTKAGKTHFNRIV